MIINDLHILGTRLGPSKADAPLSVDTNTVLTGSLALESLEAISRRHSQIADAGSDFELPQLSPSHDSDVHESLDADTFRERFSIRALE